MEHRGYGFEGAAMALDLLDQLTPWNGRRVQMLLDGPGAAHIYMVNVGVGWSMARMRLRMGHRLSQLDPLLRWLALDGYGFHEGYFHWPRCVDGQAVPQGLQGYGARAFDQGLGRSLWFVAGADPEYVTAIIDSFNDVPRGVLW
jgi:hypothetical protein